MMFFSTSIYSQVWTKLDTFPGQGRYGVQVFSINGKGYIGGTGGSGSTLYKDLYQYDPDSIKWYTKANFIGNPRRVGIGFAIDSFGYVGLGWTGSSSKYDFYQYDPSSDSWTSKTSYPGLAGRNSFGTSTKSKGYVGGGSTSTSGYRSDFYEYDPVTNSWDSLPPIPFGGRAGGTSFSIGCQVFLGLGHNGSVATSDFWVFNAQKRSWSQIANFPGSARLHASSFVLNGRAIVGGGYQKGTGKEFGDYYSYDPISNAWTSVASFSAGKRGISEGFEINNTAYLSAGWDSLNVTLNDLWSYKDTTNCGVRSFKELVSCGAFFNSTYNRQFDTSGIYFDTVQVGGCFDITTICVLIHQEYSDTIIALSCDSFVSPSGVVLKTSGVYFDSISTSFGCDSIITINLTLNYSWMDSLVVVQCGYFTGPSGTIYTSSGIYLDSINSISGCDSLMYLDLTIYPSGIIDTIYWFSCDFYIGPSGKVYVASGQYYDTIYSTTGCDSIYFLDLNVNITNTTINQSGNILFALTPQASYQWLDCDNNMQPIQGETGQSIFLTRN